MKRSHRPEQTLARRWGSVLTLVALLAFVAGCGGSGSGSAPTTRSTAAPATTGSGATTTGAAGTVARTTTFRSKRYGYSIALAGDSARYSTLPADVNWKGSVPNLSNIAYDHIKDLQSGRFLLIAAKRVPAGMTLRKWMAFLVSIINPGCSRPDQSFTKSTLGGAPALGIELTCSEGIAVLVGSVHARRGYFFTDVTFKPKLQAADRRALDSLQRSFSFTG